MIRSAEMSDVKDLTNLCLQLGYAETETDIKERLSFIIEKRDQALFVYENQNGLVSGWVHIFGKHLLEGVFAEIGGLVVDCKHRRQGIGKMLMKKCESWAMEHGYSEIRVRSNGIREKAHQFYLDMGYKNIKWQKVFNRLIK
ncbi:GNAT family N-acetyltransferase [Terrilactibacillus sp. BCM23-1]|uniref:GNAT family N-acetyltransferase n=1 Tax=Terrilactibacillus tamarindi TaxID=2599694 RepID=A0A6N8CLE1_9BACI|nr:GNAT family N-acetyltransferase [Terrilactibacillus tamarindi]MTT30722.1 GNAT family N-acetyltransferase [Terrilactibacillus tamarindi]